MVSSPRVLLLYGGDVGVDSAFFKNAESAMARFGVDYEARSIDADIAYQQGDAGSYAAVLISDYAAYDALASDQRQALDLYARSCRAGLYFLYVPASSQLNAGQVEASLSLPLANPRVDPHSGMLLLTKDGGVLEGPIPGLGRMLTVRNGTGYLPAAWAMNGTDAAINVLADNRAYDGIKRVFNGQDFEVFFLNELLLVDALQWLSPIPLNLPTERWIGVDIDDVFMPNYNNDPAQRTVKIQAEDVTALIAGQDHISSMLQSEFRFTLGFNVGFFHKQFGDPSLFDDPAGDDALVGRRAEFHWFDHLQFHTVIDTQPVEELVGFMRAGHDWAEQTGVIDYVGHYAVSPRHSGVSEQYTPLYQAWHEVWDVHHTSDTSGVGAGFEYMGVLVVPRQTVSIWSVEYSFTQVKQSFLEKGASGGAAYRMLVSRPVSIVMTHSANYARDRVGLYLFEQLFAFVTRWTTLRIRNGTDDELVDKYFEYFPLDCGKAGYSRAFRDGDGDGFGDPHQPHGPVCPLPDGYVYNAEDCNDGDAAAFPAAVETCNGRDDDCDGHVDEFLPVCSYADADAGL